MAGDNGETHAQEDFKEDVSPEDAETEESE